MGPPRCAGVRRIGWLGSTVSMIRAGMRSVIGFRPIGFSGERMIDGGAFV
jgi:hypothetical protein